MCLDMSCNNDAANSNKIIEKSNSTLQVVVRRGELKLKTERVDVHFRRAKIPLNKSDLSSPAL